MTDRPPRVPLCDLYESVTENGVQRLRGRIGHAGLVGWLDRDTGPSLRRWQIFAQYSWPDPQTAPEHLPRIFLLSLIEKVSHRGVRRLSGRLGPTKVVAFLKPGSKNRWQVFLERFETWEDQRPTAERDISQNAPTESAQRGRIPQCETE